MCDIEISVISLRKPELALDFYQRNTTKHTSFAVEWPSARSMVWARLSPDPSRDLTTQLYKKLILAAAPSEFRTYFATSTEDGEYENEALKSLLSSHGEPFVEKSRVTGKKASRRTLIRVLTGGRRVPVTAHTLLASTKHREVVETIIDQFKFWWPNFFLYPFIVSKAEISGWQDQLLSFTVMGNGHPEVKANLIEGGRCVIVTIQDHAIELISDKISENEVRNFAQDIAVDLNCDLGIYEDDEPR